MDSNDIDLLVRVLDGSPWEQQLFTALRVQLFTFGDHAGNTHCIVFGDVKVWWPEEAQNTLHSEMLGKGKWCGVLKIKTVLDKCTELDIETPEDFGMPIPMLNSWTVNAMKPQFEFSISKPANKPKRSDKAPQ